jgi:ubiquitin-activating enzyme E1
LRTALFTGKFMPIRQWFYYDAVEALHDTPLPAEEVAPRGCRYDGQIMVFGRSIQVRVCELCSLPVMFPVRVFR